MNENKLEQTRKNRFLFLHKLFELAGGSNRKRVSMWEVGQMLSLEKEEIENVVEYLAGERLLEHATVDGGLAITHHGRKEVENALSAPESSTSYFPPVINILNVQSMVGSQVQQGTHQSSQKLSFEQHQVEAVREFITALKRELPQMALSNSDRSETEADIATIEAQLQSNKPKRGIVQETLKSLRAVLEGAAGSTVAAGLLSQLTGLIQMLSN